MSGFALFSREVPLKDAKEYAEAIGAVVVETSAKNAINIEELFQGISKYLICVFSIACNFLKKLINLFISIFGCVGSSFLCEGFL